MRVTEYLFTDSDMSGQKFVVKGRNIVLSFRCLPGTSDSFLIQVVGTKKIILNSKIVKRLNTYTYLSIIIIISLKMIGRVDKYPRTEGTFQR